MMLFTCAVISSSTFLLNCDSTFFFKDRLVHCTHPSSLHISSRVCDCFQQFCQPKCCLPHWSPAWAMIWQSLADYMKRFSTRKGAVHPILVKTLPSVVVINCKYKTMAPIPASFSSSANFVRRTYGWECNVSNRFQRGCKFSAAETPHRFLAESGLRNVFEMFCCCLESPSERHRR